ncbi:putative ribonuclease H-like domain-containing protein [Tanacetum coccineum]
MQKVHQFDSDGYQMGLESLEARIVVHEKNEAVYEEDIAFLKLVKDIVEKLKTVSLSAPIIEEWDTDSDNDSVFRPKSDQTKSKFTKINFVKSDNNVKFVNKENTHRQVEYPKKSQSPRDNRKKLEWDDDSKTREWFWSLKGGSLFICGSFNHLIKDYDFHDNKMVEKPVLNNKGRVTAVATKFKTMTELIAAKQSSQEQQHQLVLPGPVNTATPKPKRKVMLPALTEFLLLVHLFCAAGQSFDNADDLPTDPLMPDLEDTADLLNTIIGDKNSATQTRRMTKISEAHALVSYINKQRRTNHKDYQNCLFSCFSLSKEPRRQHASGKKWVYRNKKDERGIVVRNKARLVAQGYTQEEGIDYDEVFAPVARIEAIRLFLAYASFMGFIMYQMDVKSAFLYGNIEEEVYVCQPPSFEDPQFPDKVYKVEKALYGLHQAPRAWYETLSTYLLENGFRRGTIDKNLFIKKDKGDILVKQKDDGIFISQDKYVVDILKKFDFVTVKTTSTPIETNKALLKDKEAGMWMFQVTPKVSHIHVVKRIFRYLKGQPKLGLWYPRDSSFDLEAFSDSVYAGASLDRKSTTGGCQFLGKRLISWQCKKQTIVANPLLKQRFGAVGRKFIFYLYKRIRLHRFEDPQFPNKVYKVEKALYGLHQAPKAWYETLSTYLLENRFRRGTIDKTLFIKKDKGDILSVQVYVDDIIFRSTKKSLCVEFEQMMHKRFQMSSIWELTFFLRLQVKQKYDGIFISQDKYVADILKKFDFSSVKKTSTPIETNKALLKDENAEDMDVHLYISMIGSLMYLTAFRPDIMFAVCACVRFQVTPKILHLHAVKRIFRYLKGQPKLGLWYPKDSPFDLEAFSNSDYARASLDRKSTIRVEGEGSVQPSEPQPPSLTAPPSQEEQVPAIATSHLQKTQIHRQAKRGRDTEIPQFGGPPKKVGDEAVHKDLGDRVERAATTAASLDAEQDNESMGGTIAQTRSERVPTPSYDSPLSGGHTPGSDEDCSRFGDQKAEKEGQKIGKEAKGKNSRDKTLQDCYLQEKELDKEYVSKQGRKRDKTKPMFDDSDFAKLDVDNAMENVEGDAETQGRNTAEQTTTTGNTINTASINVSTADPSTIVIRDVEEEPRRATPIPIVQSQDKEIAQRLFEEEQEQFEREQRIARERAAEQEVKDAALIE